MKDTHTLSVLQKVLKREQRSSQVFESCNWTGTCVTNEKAGGFSSNKQTLEHELVPLQLMSASLLGCRHQRRSRLAPCRREEVRQGEEGGGTGILDYQDLVGDFHNCEL